MNAKEFDEMALVLLAYALEFQDLFEVGVGAVSNVNEVGLH